MKAVSSSTRTLLKYYADMTHRDMSITVCVEQVEISHDASFCYLGLCVFLIMLREEINRAFSFKALKL